MAAGSNASEKRVGHHGTPWNQVKHLHEKNKNGYADAPCGFAIGIALFNSLEVESFFCRTTATNHLYL